MCSVNRKLIEKYAEYKNGDLVWRVSHGFIKAGKPMGQPTVSICGKRYRSADVVWLLNTGRRPVRRLRHLNGDSLDIRFENLSEQPERAPQRPAGRKRLDFWVRMTVIGENYVVELTERGKRPVLLISTPDYDQAATAQRMALYVPG